MSDLLAGLAELRLRDIISIFSQLRYCRMNHKNICSLCPVYRNNKECIMSFRLGFASEFVTFVGFRFFRHFLLLTLTYKKFRFRVLQKNSIFGSHLLAWVSINRNKFELRWDGLIFSKFADFELCKRSIKWWLGEKIPSQKKKADLRRLYYVVRTDEYFKGAKKIKDYIDQWSLRRFMICKSCYLYFYEDTIP